jgi:hypothetical protein
MPYYRLTFPTTVNHVYTTSKEALIDHVKLRIATGEYPSVPKVKELSDQEWDDVISSLWHPTP